jgi:hypothetical protein
VTAPRVARRPHRERFVSASELGAYSYCRRAWWLRAVRGVETAEEGTRYAEGRAAHARHALGLLAARTLALLALAAAAATVVLWLTR